MNIAICDDESSLIEQLRNIIMCWCQLRECSCEIRSFASGEELLFETAGSFPFDLILLDIELGNGNLSGMDLARKIREADVRVDIAFLTNYSGYVFEGYEVSALRYLMKPVTEENLFPLLDLVRANMVRISRYLVLEIDGEQRKVDEDDILYLEARNHIVLIETKTEPLEVKAAISNLARQLSSDFIPTHRSFIVNLRHVERVGRKDCFLEDGSSIPVSRGAWEKLNQAFLNFYREV
jgi:DNA-binding LytR/AlgR family response regulator